jgi:hypothetical protein
MEPIRKYREDREVTSEAKCPEQKPLNTFRALDEFTGRLDAQLRVPARTERSDADIRGLSYGSRDSGSLSQ